MQRRQERGNVRLAVGEVHRLILVVDVVRARDGCFVVLSVRQHQLGPVLIQLLLPRPDLLEDEDAVADGMPGESILAPHSPISLHKLPTRNF